MPLRVLKNLATAHLLVWTSISVWISLSVLPSFSVFAQDSLPLIIKGSPFLEGQSPRQSLESKKFNATLVGLAEEWGGLYRNKHAEERRAWVARSLPLRVVQGDRVSEFKSLREGGLPPLFHETNNLGAAQSSRTDRLWPGGSLGLNLNGQRLTLCCVNGPNGSQPFFYVTKLGIWDGGAVRGTHQELTGRVTQMDANTTNNNHATHVAGTMIASGEQPSARGMAWAASLNAYDWSNDQSEMATAAAQGLLVSNHSYGLITGWQWGDYDNLGTDRWFWWGGENDTECADFGLYSQQARDWDLIANNAPNYLIVKAAGNDRGQGPTAGTTHRVWSNSQGNWVNSNTTRQKDGGTLGYDCISHAGVAKNVLTVGAVQGLTSPYTSPSQVVASTFHGWGPTDDGRIKPDIVAKGVNLYSSIAGSNTDYATYSGTSMASPAVTGTLALIQQRWMELRNQNVSAPVAALSSAQLKALVCHTALEAGQPGPDPVYGWGLLNAEGAVQLMAGIGDTTMLESLSLSNSGNYSRTFYSDGQRPLVLTMAWNDPAAPVSTYTLNNATPVLVNDLDVRLVRNSDGAVFEPYRLVAGQPATAAQTGDNTRDNIEQVRLSTPSAGLYTVQVSHKGALSGNQPQAFALVGSGLRLQSTLSGQIRYANSSSGPGIQGTVGVYREGDGQLVAAAVSNAQGQFTVTGLESGTYKVRASSLRATAGVNGTDALLVSRHFARTANLSGLSLEAADVNASGAISATDALQIALRFGNLWSNPNPMTLTYQTPTGSALANNGAIARLSASTDSLGTAGYTVGTWGSPSSPLSTALAGSGRHRIQLQPLNFFGQASPQPFPSGQLPVRMEFLLRENGPCGGFGGITRACVTAGDALGQAVSLWTTMNPPLSTYLGLQAAYGRFSGFATGDWLGQESRISVSSGQPITLNLQVQSVGDVDGSGF